MDTLFDLISFLALLCAFNFAYAGSARFRQVLNKDIYEIRKNLEKIPVIARRRSLVTGFLIPLSKEDFPKTKLRHVYKNILDEREKNAEFEKLYIEMFFIAGYFGVFQIGLISLRNVLREDVILTLLSYLYIVIIPIGYIFISGFTKRKTLKPLLPPMGIMHCIIAIHAIFAIGLVHCFFMTFSYSSLHFSSTQCICLSLGISISTYFLFFIRGFLHIRNNRITKKKCDRYAFNEAELNKAYIDYLTGRFFEDK